jgi:hypothetical protein
MGQKQNKVAQERQAEDSLGQAEGIWTHNSFANLSILSIWWFIKRIPREYGIVVVRLIPRQCCAAPLVP